MRQQTCTTVTLRQRPIRNGRISLYLDYYPAVRNPKTMKLSRREYLGFYIYATPKNAIELDYNNEILAKAELIRCRRQEAVINEEFGFMDRHKMRADFMAYFKEVCRKKDHKQTNDVLIIEDKLGGGWVAEETVAIAVYCSLAHFNDFEKAMVAAVNHGGDSDSTGAVTGNLLGVVFGYEALPDFYKEDLELHDVILHIADDLYNGKKTEYKR